MVNINETSWDKLAAIGITEHRMRGSLFLSLNVSIINETKRV